MKKYLNWRNGLVAVVLLGVLAMWTGLMQEAKECGLMDTMPKILRKPVKWIFPTVPEGHPAEEAIISNIVANILGLGWAATPAGLKAMKHL